MNDPQPDPYLGVRPGGPRSGFGIRLGALLIDDAILLVVNLVLRATLGDARGLIGTVLGAAYFIVQEGGPTGQTVGKKLMGVRVVDAATGGPIGLGRAAIRYVAHIASALALGLGFLWMLWDSQRQTWHDKLAGTLVVPVSAFPANDARSDNAPSDAPDEDAGWGRDRP